MDLHYLRIFYEVAKEKSFTKAASNLYINQSAVSIQIKKFEDHFNAKLFDRSSKKIKLTYAGEMLFKTAEDIFQKVKRAEKEMENIVLYERGKIVIGATHIIGEPVLPKAIKKFLEKYEGIEVEVHIQERDVLIDWIKEGKVDAALMGDFFIKDESLTILSIGTYPFVVVAKDYYDSVKLLEEMPLIARSDSLLTEKNIDYFQKTNNIKISKRITVNGSIEAVKNFVLEGMGFTIIPYHCVYKEILKKELFAIEDFKKFKDGYQIVYAKDKEENSELNKFIQFIKSFDIGYDIG